MTLLLLPPAFAALGGKLVARHWPLARSFARGGAHSTP